MSFELRHLEEGALPAIPDLAHRPATSGTTYTGNTTLASPASTTFHHNRGLRPAASTDTLKVPGWSLRSVSSKQSLIKQRENPKTYSTAIKYTTLILVSCFAASDAIASAILYPGLPFLPAQFNTTPTVANLAGTVPRIARAFAPLWWSYVADRRGRRMLMLLSAVLFIVFSILSALSTSIGMLIAMQILATTASSAGTPLGAGVVSDMWEPREKGKAFGIFYIGVLAGPGIGPVFGGALVQGFDWRATQWFMAIWAGCCLVGLALCLPETLAKARETSDKDAIRKQGFKNWLIHAAKASGRAVYSPLKVFGFLKLPAVLLNVYLASVAFGTLGMLSISLQDVFSKPGDYNFEPFIVGFTYLPMGVGMIATSLVGGKWTDAIMARKARKAGRYDANGKPVYLPADRMGENAWVSAVIFPIAILGYGWLAKYGVAWPAPVSRSRPCINQYSC